MRKIVPKQDRGPLQAMVKTAHHQIATMEQIERQAEYSAKLVASFSLYVGARFAKSLLLLELVLPDPEAQTPELRAQLDHRLDQLEQNLDQIEQRTMQKIIHLIES